MLSLTPYVAGKVALAHKNTNQSGTVVAAPNTGTYMLALCLWIQTSSTDPAATVTASVSYNNGMIATSESTSTITFGPTSNRSCTVIPQHIVSGTAVTYSTSISGSVGSGTYGFDIVETQAQ